MKRVIFAVVVVLIVVAYFAGYWPERTKLQDAERRLAHQSSQLASAQQVVRLCRLQNQVLILVQEAGSQNYGDAMTLSTRFFDGVRDELDRAKQSALKSSLQSILAQRDAVTSALAKGEPAAQNLLQQQASALQKIVMKETGS